ncbi:hypothetical protein E2562_028677 [Oryza meyeriana var. granulata]|uniref:Uncharacterized protein n=1 Tax=Oryza meyeriana var. granulata TaxID=110450 RepID=A0A6G1BNY7_9ORYZ|nr:hypothetical protein E2562_028677 [Oryza meyeriana var. granulata]
MGAVNFLKPPHEHTVVMGTRGRRPIRIPAAHLYLTSSIRHLLPTVAGICSSHCQQNCVGSEGLQWRCHTVLHHINCSSVQSDPKNGRARVVGRVMGLWHDNW